MSGKDIRTTGQLRELLADATKWVLNGSMDIEKAQAIHKLAKNISDSLYSETKIRMFEKEAGETIHKMGELPLGDPQSK